MQISLLIPMKINVVPLLHALSWNKDAMIPTTDLTSKILELWGNTVPDKTSTLATMKQFVSNVLTLMAVPSRLTTG